MLKLGSQEQRPGSFEVGWCEFLDKRRTEVEEVESVQCTPHGDFGGHPSIGCCTLKQQYPTSSEDHLRDQHR